MNIDFIKGNVLAQIGAVACVFFLNLASAFSQGLVFTVSTNATGTTNSGPLLVADVNGDGKPDLIFANNPNSGQLTVFTNNGNGTLVANITLTVTTNPISITAADVNNDGYVDLICANLGAPTEFNGSLIILTNNGSGGFGSNATLSTGRYPISVAAADINGDGYTDLVCANKVSGSLTVFTNDGSGVFGFYDSISVIGVSSMIAADVNGDHKMDLVYADDDSELVILTNNGSGVFGFYDSIGVTGVSSVVAADVNGDGNIDLICTSPSANKLTVLTNTGGGFAVAATVDAGPNPSSIVATNLNGGCQVVLVQRKLWQQYAHYSNQQRQRRLWIQHNAHCGKCTGVRVVSDLKGDGKLELITAASDRTLMVLEPSARFTAGIYPVGSEPSCVVAADVNGDGKPDLICANDQANTLTVLTNNGSGLFVSNATLMVGSGPLSVAAADVNGDGYVDLISANYGSDTLTVLTNNGFGIFRSNATLNVGSGPECVIAADVNGDGYMDLVSANWAGATLTILTNNGSGGFALSSTFQLEHGPSSVVATNVNSDGYMDLICTDLGNPLFPTATLSVLTNDGSGQFASDATPAVGLDPSCIIAADVNGDGFVDLICANEGAYPDYNGTVSVLTNDGFGHFVSAGTFNVGTMADSVAAADVSGDGYMDLVCANRGLTPSENYGTLTVLTNNGQGVFGLNSTLDVGLNPSCVIVADVNGDGEMDLICANAGDNTLRVLTKTIVPPPLSIASTGPTALVISWPSFPTGFELQMTSDLTTTNWILASYPVSTNGLMSSVAITPSPTGNLFFRLSR